MAVLSGNIKPITVARVGLMRVKQSRVGYAPKDTQADGENIWKSSKGPYNLDDTSAEDTWTNTRS